MVDSKFVNVSSNVTDVVGKHLQMFVTMASLQDEHGEIETFMKHLVVLIKSHIRNH
jgi:hypothetical protein